MIGGLARRPDSAATMVSSLSAASVGSAEASAGAPAPAEPMGSDAPRRPSLPVTLTSVVYALVGPAAWGLARFEQMADARVRSPQHEPDPITACGHLRSVAPVALHTTQDSADGATSMLEAKLNHSPTLAALVEASQRTHPTYGDDMTNHLPMTLCAMAGLGASAEQLTRFDASYRPRLEPLIAADARVAVDDIGAVAVDRAMIPQLVAGFRDAIAARGAQAVLRQSLSVLSGSVGTAAFHCMIRTAYGIEFGISSEVAQGLAYWTATRESLAQLALPRRSGGDGKAGTTGPLDLLGKIARDPAWRGLDVRADLISERMALVASRPGFAAVSDGLEVNLSTLPAVLSSIRDAVLKLYATVGDFVSLHALTSTYALRILLPFASEPETLIRYHWQALVAAYIAMGAPTLRDAPTSRRASWQEITDAALESDDDHHAKLVYACLQEWRVSGDDRYRSAAAMRLALA